jgi:hypothetical protein
VENHYPVYFSGNGAASTTSRNITQENNFPGFYSENETVDLDRFNAIGVIKKKAVYDEHKLQYFADEILSIQNNGKCTRSNLINLFKEMSPNFEIN